MQGLIFSMFYICGYLSTSAKIWTKNKHVPTQFFFKIKLFFLMNFTFLWINKFQCNQIITKKFTLKEKFSSQTFSEPNAPLPPKQKKIFFFRKFHLKAEGHSISEGPGLTPWPKNLRKKLFSEHRQCSFTAPIKCTFCSTSGH